MDHVEVSRVLRRALVRGRSGPTVLRPAVMQTLQAFLSQS